jgi:hypothetical protein
MKYFKAYLNSVKNFFICFAVLFLFDSITKGNLLAEGFAYWSIVGGLFGPIGLLVNHYYE